MFVSFFQRKIFNEFLVIQLITTETSLQTSETKKRNIARSKYTHKHTNRQSYKYMEYHITSLQEVRLDKNISFESFEKQWGWIYFISLFC